MKIALYYAPNTCALAPYITLTEAGADFEVRPLNYRKRQNFSPEYLRINPKHKVPALVVDGKILTENVAIHQWVHRTFPDAKILPGDPWDQLQAISLHSWCASGIHPYLSRINNPPKVCDAAGASDSVIKLATEFLFACLCAQTQDSVALLAIGDKTKHAQAEKLRPLDPKFRGVFAIFVRIVKTRRYRVRRPGIRTLAAFLILREQVIKPCIDRSMSTQAR